MSPLQFAEVVDTLQGVTAAGQQRNWHGQDELLRGLFNIKKLEQPPPQGGYYCDRPRGELRALLRLLLPSEDREHVYGLKTRRLLTVLSAALGKIAGHEADAARLRQWHPTPCRSEWVRDAVVCMPEVAMAAAAAAVHEGHHHGNDGAEEEEAFWRAHTVLDVEQVCARIAATFQAEKASQRPSTSSSSERLVALQTENFVRLLRHARGLDFHGWLLLLRVLLKRIPIGVGPAAVLRVLPLGTLMGGGSFYARRRTLEELALAIGRPSAACLAVRGGGLRVECGTPFRPMTGDALRAPYLMKWIFSREERLRQLIPPIEGRLVIVLARPSAAGGGGVIDDNNNNKDDDNIINNIIEEQWAEQAPGNHWFVPLNARNRMRMVNLEDERILQQAKTRRRHLLLLRALKRSNLIDEGNAQGLVIHYALSAEGNGLIVCLIRDVTVATESGVELADEVSLELQRPAEVFRTLPTKAEFLPRLLRTPSAASENESEIVYMEFKASDAARR